MDSQWLETQFRLNPGRSKAELARSIGLDAPAISKILAGSRQIKAPEYAGMRKFFGLPVDGERAVASENSYVISPLGEQGFEENGLVEEENDKAWVMPASLFEKRTQATPEQIRIFSIQENTMTPDFVQGEQVLVDLSDKQPSPSGVFIVSDGLGHIVRQCSYVPHSEPAELKLSPLNRKYESHTVLLEKAEIIGRVIAKLQWL